MGDITHKKIKERVLQMKTMVISFGSATIAMKAKKILNRNSIGARLIKPDLIKSKRSLVATM